MTEEQAAPVAHKRADFDTAACGVTTYDGCLAWDNVTCPACLTRRPDVTGGDARE